MPAFRVGIGEDGVGLAHERAYGLSAEVSASGSKRKGPAIKFHMLVKRHKRFVSKKSKAPLLRNTNPYTTSLKFKRGITRTANVHALLIF